MSFPNSSLGYSLPYIPAELQHHKNSNGWIIVYYVRNPTTGSFNIFRLKLNRYAKKYKSILEFKAFAYKIVQDINNKLAGGWSPYGESVAARLYEDLHSTLEKYLRVKKPELTSETFRSYSSQVAILQKWIQKVVPGITCGGFNKHLAIRLMEDRWSGSISARTYNNNIKCYRCVFNWLLEFGYIKENHFLTMHTKSTIEKERNFIPVEQLLDIFRYVRDNMPNFYLVLLLIYYSGLRPIEVARLRVGDLDLDAGCINLHPNQTKNHRAAFSNLSSELVTLLRSHIDGVDKDWYLFGNDLVPCEKQVGYEIFRHRWSKVRSILGFSPNYQLYSLRDSSGVHRFHQGADAVDVMLSLRHSNLQQTTIYVRHNDQGLHDRLEQVTPHI